MSSSRTRRPLFTRASARIVVWREGHFLHLALCYPVFESPEISFLRAANRSETGSTAIVSFMDAQGYKRKCLAETDWSKSLPCETALRLKIMEAQQTKSSNATFLWGRNMKATLIKINRIRYLRNDTQILNRTRDVTRNKLILICFKSDDQGQVMDH